MEAKMDFYRSDSQLMNDAVDRIVVDFYRRKREKGDKTFLLTGCCSEVGTTNICISLAIALSVAGWKTMLVDCDMRKANRYKRLNENKRLGLVDYLTEDLKIQEVTWNTGHENLSYIPCGNHSESPVRLLCSNRMEAFVEELKKEYDFIIFDFPTIDIVPDAEILIPFVDSIALVAALRKTTKRQLSAAKKVMESYNDKYAGLIVNRVELLQYRKFNHDFDYFKTQNLNDKYEKAMRKKKKR